MRRGWHLRLERDVAAFVLLVVLSSAIMILDRTGDKDLVAGDLTRVFIPFERLSSTIMNISFIREENRILRRELMRVSGENALLREQVREIDRLKDLLAFKVDYPGSLCTSRVVWEVGRRLGGGIVLDKGSDSGLERNMTAVCPDGLVGRVIKLAGHACLIKRLIDPGYRVSALIRRSRAAGVLRTQAGGRLVMEWVSPNADVAVGDTVVTSGLGSVTPKGILVGRVVHIHERPDRFSRSLEIEPFADFRHLEEVFVILEQPLDYGSVFGMESP
jgi:rod shape-determining protein MreC